MKNSLIGESISSFLAKFMTATILKVEKQNLELQESLHNHRINLEKIKDLKELFKIYDELLKTRKSPAARKNLNHANLILNSISKVGTCDLTSEIYEIQANLNLAYITMNTYKG